MKLLLHIAGAAILLATVHAQSARQLTRRIEPQLRPAPQYPANRPAGAAGTATAATAAPNRTPEQIAEQKASSDKKAFEFQLKRANEGSDRAQYDVGMRYLNGEGVARDEKAGMDWLNKASTNGSTQATKKLAELETLKTKKK